MRIQVFGNFWKFISTEITQLCDDWEPDGIGNIRKADQFCTAHKIQPALYSKPVIENASISHTLQEEGMCTSVCTYRECRMRPFQEKTAILSKDPKDLKNGPIQ